MARHDVRLIESRNAATGWRRLEPMQTLSGRSTRAATITVRRNLKP
jgi:hypothetical protein